MINITRFLELLKNKPKILHELKQDLILNLNLDANGVNLFLDTLSKIIVNKVVCTFSLHENNTKKISIFSFYYNLIQTLFKINHCTQNYSCANCFLIQKCPLYLLFLGRSNQNQNHNNSYFNFFRITNLTQTQIKKNNRILYHAAVYFFNDAYFALPYFLLALTYNSFSKILTLKNCLISSFKNGQSLSIFPSYNQNPLTTNPTNLLDAFLYFYQLSKIDLDNKKPNSLHIITISPVSNQITPENLKINYLTIQPLLDLIPSLKKLLNTKKIVQLSK